MLGLSHECLQRASETSRRGRHHLDSGGGHTICSRCWAEPIPSLAVHRGSPLARTDDRECEARSLGECMSSHQRLRRGNAARLGCFEGSASPPACATPGQQPRAGSTACLALACSPRSVLTAAHDSGNKAGRCVDAGAGSRCNRRPPAARECTGVRQWWCVVRGRIGKHGAAGLAALLA